MYIIETEQRYKTKPAILQDGSHIYGDEMSVLLLWTNRYTKSNEAITKGKQIMKADKKDYSEPTFQVTANHYFVRFLIEVGTSFFG